MTPHRSEYPPRRYEPVPPPRERGTCSQCTAVGVWLSWYDKHTMRKVCPLCGAADSVTYAPVRSTTRQAAADSAAADNGTDVPLFDL